jgi:hypothetical protein
VGHLSTSGTDFPGEPRVSTNFSRFVGSYQVLLICFVIERREVVAAKNFGRTTKSGVNTREKKHRFHSGRRAIPWHAGACTELYSKLKISWNGRKLMELFEIEVDSRGAAPRRRSKRHRSRNRPKGPSLVRPGAIPVVIEVPCSSPVSQPPGRPGSRPPTGSSGDPRRRTTPNRAHHSTKPYK